MTLDTTPSETRFFYAGEHEGMKNRFCLKVTALVRLLLRVETMANVCLVRESTVECYCEIAGEDDG